MPKIIITNNQLFHIEQEITRLQMEWPGLYLLVQGKLHAFLKATVSERKIFNDKLRAIQGKYIQYDGNDMPIYANEERTAWLFKESVAGRDGQLLTGDQVSEAYEAEATEFFNRSVTINF
ncbi:MAG: hypothetical protein EOP50_00225 [Sphingobacteriales bacterium]|nr:MAG: hypothetical protein EOP50_00225 [Sphingobacteriales bacterium]